jgi:adenosylmethionine---8-amino-7-oxononanoate aminotransferase
MNTSFPSLGTAELLALDRQHVWHPCTQMSDHEWLPMLAIARAEGAYLFDSNGKRYLDAISSWWTCLLGHRHPAIMAALHAQLEQLDHVIFAGCTHAPATELASALCQLSGFDKVFYADVGSAAVEVALKLSFHYWHNVGQPHKTRFICLSGSYHGETLGALSVTDVALYRKTYGAILLNPIITPSPDAYLAPIGVSAEAWALQQADQLEAILSTQHQQVCALILEPLVQCAGGMRMYHPAYLKRARQLCDQYNVHLIADEIAVGFGRTGTMFACEQADIRADFLLLGKGLTGGVLPLAAVLTTHAIFEQFYAPHAELKAFLHSHSFTANPLACAAALATVRALSQENTLHANLTRIEHLKKSLKRFENQPNIGDIRQTGMIAAIELVQDVATKTPFDWRERRGLAVYQHGLARGMLLRPLGNVVYVMPPFCLSNFETDEMLEVAASGIAVALRG